MYTILLQDVSKYISIDVQIFGKDFTMQTNAQTAAIVWGLIHIDSGRRFPPLLQTELYCLFEFLLVNKVLLTEYSIGL